MELMNWGLIGTGGIVKSFLTGLRAARGARPAAVASRSQEKADAFAKKYGIEKGYGNVDEMLADPEIQVVYIGTPHTTHKEYALKAIAAGKAVLCEKPVTINASEMKEIVEAARQHHVFFMEAMWTRFLPAVVKVRDWIAGGAIGEVKMMEANFGFVAPWEPEWRLLNVNLGGGALLDAGTYPISFASMVFGGKKPEKIGSVAYIGETHVDEEFMGVISYGGQQMASVNAALRTGMVSDAWIYGSSGKIQVPDFVFARSATLFANMFSEHYEPECVANGYNYEAEEVMNCIRGGKLESDVMPLDESLQIMETLDTMRAQWGFKYPFEK